MAATKNTEAEYSLEDVQPRSFEARSEVSLYEVLTLLFRRARLIVASAFAAMAVTAIVVFIIPPSFSAEAVILPPQPEQSAQALLAGLPGGLGGLGGLAGAGGAVALWRNPGDVYVGILKSRTIADALIAEFQLEQLYERRNLTDARKELARHTTITTGKDLLIRIRVEDHDRNRAAQIANAYVDELHRQNSRMAITSASQRRLFFETQLSGEKKALAEAEIALKNMQQASGLVYPPGQSEVLIRSAAQLRAEIAGREVQLESMRSYATEANPQVHVVRQELVALREQLAKLESGRGVAGTLITGSRLPDASIEYIRRLRDLKYHEALFEILARQYEAARIDEARLAPVIQVLDLAVAPDKKSWPPRMLFVVGAGFLGAIAAVLVVLTGNYRRTKRAVP